MPVYDFRCEDCQHIFEVQVLSAGLFIRGGNTPVCAPDAPLGCCQPFVKRESI